MKFVSKSVSPTTDVWIVTYDMAVAIEKSGIRYSDLGIPDELKKLTLNELGSYILLQERFARFLGKYEDVHDFNIGDMETKLGLNKVFEQREDIDTYFIELLNKHNRYFYRKSDETLVIMIGLKEFEEKDYPGWTLLEGDKLSLALTDVLYKSFSYQDLHFDAAIKTSDDEFSLAHTFYALERGL